MQHEENKPDRVNRAAFLEALGEAGGLSADRRRAILDAAMERPAGRAGWMPLMDLRRGLLAAAAVLLAAVLVPVFQPGGGTPRVGSEVVPAQAPLLELRAQDGAVVLEWRSGGAPAQVLRSTDPRGLATAPRERVDGNSWVDPQKNGAQIVYYRVEEAL